MTYKHVARSLLAGYMGLDGSIPADVTYGTPVTSDFSYTLPAEYDENEIHIVVMVIEQSTGEIVNGVEVELDITSGIKEANSSNFNIYPNPTTGIVNISGVKDAQVVVYNMLGAVVYNEANASATTTIDLSSFNAGNYIVKVINNDEVSTQKIVLTK